jgi:perosamine synthetase
MIPVNEPKLGLKDHEYVLECLRTGWISSAGSFLDSFESGWANYCGMKHGIAVSNGTTALQIAVEGLQLGAGDEVILPTFTIISCITAVISAGAKPVLVDSEPDTWTMAVDQIESKISDRTRAILPVHMYGHPVDMDVVCQIAQKHGLAVIEDAAEAHGAKYYSKHRGKWLTCGGLGTISTFSFYANKLVTTGEGGMVLTNDDALAARFKSLRNLCFRSDRRFLHTELGHNFRLTNLQAALGVAQIERIDEIVARKREIASRYTKALTGVAGLQLPVEREWARSVYWMYGIVLAQDVDFDAAELARRLRDGGIETRPFFLGMHEQPVLVNRGLFSAEHYPVADTLAARGLYLPSGLGLTDAQIEDVVAAVRKAMLQQ